jgi:hypothetical protein
MGQPMGRQVCLTMPILILKNKKNLPNGKNTCIFISFFITVFILRYVISYLNI